VTPRIYPVNCIFRFRQLPQSLVRSFAVCSYGLMDSLKKASEIVATLDLKAHPDGGFYAETFRDPSISLSKSQLPPRCTLSLSVFSFRISFFFDQLLELRVLCSFACTCIDKVDRAVSSAIYFLLPSGGIAHLHRIPCAETWHYYGGEPLTVRFCFFVLANFTCKWKFLAKNEKNLK
jgi:Cupin superfamily (DUF985)